MNILQAPDRNSKAVWATVVASWIVTKAFYLACGQWVAFCPLLTPDNAVLVSGLLAGFVSHYVPLKAQEILNLAASVKIERPDIPTASPK